MNSGGEVKRPGSKCDFTDPRLKEFQEMCLSMEKGCGETLEIKIRDEVVKFPAVDACKGAAKYITGRSNQNYVSTFKGMLVLDSRHAEYAIEEVGEAVVVVANPLDPRLDGVLADTRTKFSQTTFFFLNSEPSNLGSCYDVMTWVLYIPSAAARAVCGGQGVLTRKFDMRTAEKPPDEDVTKFPRYIKDLLPELRKTDGSAKPVLWAIERAKMRRELNNSHLAQIGSEIMASLEELKGRSSDPAAITTIVAELETLGRHWREIQFTDVEAYFEIVFNSDNTSDLISGVYALRLFEEDPKVYVDERVKLEQAKKTPNEEKVRKLTNALNKWWLNSNPAK